MTAKSKAREPRSRKPSSSNDITERIRQRAYQLYEERGRIDGHASDDWLQAEAEVLGAKAALNRNRFQFRIADRTADTGLCRGLVERCRHGCENTHVEPVGYPSGSDTMMFLTTPLTGGRAGRMRVVLW